MTDPVASTGSALKRVPKWAWIAGIGVTGGIVFYRWRNRGSTADSGAANDATAAADYGMTDNPGYVTAAPAVGGDGSAYSYPTGGIPIEQLPDLLGAIQAAQPPPISPVDLINSILPYIGGGAPTSTTTAAEPAPVQAAPVAPSPPAPAPKPKDCCTGEFPFDAGGCDCYKVVCATGKGDHAKGRWHFHKNGREVRVATTC